MYKVVKSLRGHQLGDNIKPKETDLKFLLENGVIVEVKEKKTKKQSKEEE